VVLTIEIICGYGAPLWFLETMQQFSLSDVVNALSHKMTLS
jgi:hypothetical protein